MIRYRIEWDKGYRDVADRCVIGRDPECDIQLLEDASVSRRHIIVTVHTAGYAVTDLDSKNGSWVDGQRLKGTRELNGSTLLRVGGTELRVTLRTDGTRHEKETIQDDDDSAWWADDVICPTEDGPTEDQGS